MGHVSGSACQFRAWWNINAVTLQAVANHGAAILKIFRK